MTAKRRLANAERLKCANTGHSATARRMGQVDPELPYEIGFTNGR